MARTAKARLTSELLELLTEYLDVADAWDMYYTAAINKTFELKGDHRKMYAYIQVDVMIPLMGRCRALGWAYRDLVYIIPSAFETTEQERWALLRDLYVWVEEEYLKGGGGGDQGV